MQAYKNHLTPHFLWKVDIMTGFAAAILDHDLTLRVVQSIIEKDRCLDSY